MTAGVSGAAVALLGVLMALGRPRFHAFLLGAFLFLWGAWAVLVNLWRLAALRGDWADARLLFLLSGAVLVVIYLPLAAFAFSYPTRHGPLKRPWPAVAVLALPAFSGMALLWSAPEAFLGRFEGNSLNLAQELGPAFIGYHGLITVGVGLALWELRRFRAAASTEIERRQAGHVMIAFAAYLAYATGDVFASYTYILARDGTRGLTFPGIILYVLTPLYLYVLWKAHHNLLTGPSGSRFSAPKLVALSTLAGVGGLIAGVARAGVGNDVIETVGVWRLGFAILVAHAVLRFQLFDLDRRIERALVTVPIWALVVGGGLLIQAGIQQAVRPPWLADTLGMLLFLSAAGTLVYFTVRHWRRSTARPIPVGEELRRLEATKQDVYEAVLVQRFHEAPAGDDQVLPKLRSELGITPSEHQALLDLVVGRASAHAEGATAPGQWIASRYQVERLLGTGAFGQTWRAWDALLARQVVLKQLHDDVGGGETSGRAFIREARLAARVEHPNVVRVYDFGLSPGGPYIVYECVHDQSLAKLLGGRRGLPFADAMRIIRGMLRGLAALHDGGVVHGDIKPSNILIDAVGSPRITDFGSAVFQGGGSADARFATGSPAFMSPEAAAGEPPRPASDVYSAAALFYYVLEGEPYLDLEGLSLAEARRVIQHQPPKPFRRPLASEMRTLFLAALAKDPEDRPATARDFSDALDFIPVAAAVNRRRTTATSVRASARRRGAASTRRPSAAVSN